MRFITSLLFFFLLSTLFAAGKKEIILDFTKGKNFAPGVKYLLRGDSGFLQQNGKTALHILPSGKGPSGVELPMRDSVFAPAGAFQLEITFRMNPMNYNLKQSFSVLFDSKNVHYPSKHPGHNRGLMIIFQRDNYLPMYIPQISFGFGKESKIYSGRHIKVDDKQHTLLLEYIPSGRGRLLIDGKENMDFELPSSPVASPVFNVTIGDRNSAPHFPFNGSISKVRFTHISTPLLNIFPKGRRAFIRNEKDALLKLEVKNLGRKELSNIIIKGTLGAFPLPEQHLSRLTAGEKALISLPVMTTLEKGEYDLLLNAEFFCGGRKIRQETKENIMIAPILRDRMKIFSWGYGHWDFDIAREIGFTHTVEWHPSHVYVRKKADPDHLNHLYYRYLDDMLFRGMGLWDLFHAAYMHKKFPRINREGKPFQTAHPNMDATNPEGIRETLEVARNVAEAYKDHPAYEGTLLNSEIRDNSRPSFAPHQIKEYKEKFGCDIPTLVSDRSAPHYTNIPNFPFNRIVNEKDPLLTYYTWFWKVGDGWNPLHSSLNNVFKKSIRRSSYKTLYDPAVRVPPIWGNGGNVDVLSHWTYAYPDPLRVMVATEENMAMARGGNQDLFNMTQLICYRSQTAPRGKKLANAPTWTKDSPNAKYITIAPDMMRLALWSQLSRKVSAVMFHGFNTLRKPANKEGLKGTGYICTNEDTIDVLKEMFKNIVEPLGPVLKRIPERKKEVAILESFTSSMFAGEATMGQSGWNFDAALMLIWANMAPGVIYEEDILYKDALKDVKVLFLPNCEVLPEKVYNAILRFQEKGGILVGDEKLVPTITPDISISSIQRIQTQPRESKKALADAGLAIRRELAPYYTPYVRSSNSDLVTHVRSSGKADYLFILNDKRTFGSYWGPYGLVEEKGLPNKGTITLQRKNTRAVYDLLTGREVPFTISGNGTTLQVSCKGGEGKLYLILPEKLESTVLEAPGKALRGKPFTVKISVKDAGGVVTHIHPIHLEVKDPAGKIQDDSTFAALEKGIYQQTITLPLNGKKGSWLLTATDLATGRKTVKQIQVD